MAKKARTNPAPLYRIEQRLTPKAKAAFNAAVKQWQKDVAAGKPPNPAALKPLVKVTEDGTRMAGTAAAVQANGLRAGLNLAFDLTNPRAVSWAKQNAGRLIKEIGSETRQAVRQAIQRSMRGELTVDQVKRYVREIVGLTSKQEQAVYSFYDRALESGFADADALTEANAYAESLRRYRSEVIARTEVLRAENAGQELLWEQGKESGALAGFVRRWSATGDELQCEICAEMHGQTTEIGEPWTLPDGSDAEQPQDAHPQCLPGDMLVRGAQALGLTQRRYDGDLCIIRTAGGQELAVTPNHPILGRQGWIPAHLVRVGDDLVGQPRPDGMIAIGHDEYQRPTAIQDVARAFGHPRGVPPVEVPLTAKDFHGDATEGEVAVVWAYRHLLPHLAAARPQGRDQRHLQRTDMIQPRLCAACMRLFTGERFRHTARRLVRGLDLLRAAAWSHLLPLQALGLRPASWRHARPSHPQRDTAADHAVALREALDRRPLLVVAQHHLPYQRVVEVVSARHRGTVWNMETAHGIYLAQGILCHNCRCSEVLVEER